MNRVVVSTSGISIETDEEDIAASIVAEACFSVLMISVGDVEKMDEEFIEGMLRVLIPIVYDVLSKYNIFASAAFSTALKTGDVELLMRLIPESVEL